MWIRRETFNTMVNQIESSKLALLQQQEMTRSASSDKRRAEDYKECHLSMLKEKNKAIEKLKEQLKAKEEIFIGRTVKKLLESMGKTQVINRHIRPSLSELQARSNLGRELF